ncbi:MAG: Rrf2 family transcriptional regulator [bacterium]
MKLLTKETDYVVRAVMNLAVNNKNGFISSREIADNEKIPFPFLRRILQRLIKEGIVESKEGIAGGVKLNVRPGAVRISDLIKIFQGDIKISQCMFRNRLCENRRKCVLRRRLLKIEEKLAREFEKITVGSLLRDLKK